MTCDEYIYPYNSSFVTNKYLISNATINEVLTIIRN